MLGQFLKCACAELPTMPCRCPSPTCTRALCISTATLQQATEGQGEPHLDHAQQPASTGPHVTSSTWGVQSSAQQAGSLRAPGGQPDTAQCDHQESASGPLEGDASRDGDVRQAIAAAASICPSVPLAVSCSCGMRFCFHCGLAPHAPVDCQAVSCFLPSAPQSRPT